MIYPYQFVNSMIRSGKRIDLAEIIDSYRKEIRNDRATNNLSVYIFADRFLVKVINELKSTSNAEAFEQNSVLTLWEEIGFFGLKMDVIQDYDF